MDLLTGGPINASPGIGSKGQECVKSVFGTVIWMTGTHRLYAPNNDGDLLRRLRVVFPPFNTVHDSASYRRRRTPVSFAETASSGRQGFRF